jgi:hypothetical protein
MDEGKERIRAVLSNFLGRDGEPENPTESYILKAMWLMMLSEFEADIKTKVENHIDEIRKMDISDIHVCLLIKHFFGGKEDNLTPSKIVSFYKRSASEISYQYFTGDRVPKYKAQAVTKLFNNLGIFLTEEDEILLSELNSAASTRDSIAHGDFDIQITRKELEEKLDNLSVALNMLSSKLLGNF